MTEAQVQPLDVLASPVRREILDTLANLPRLAKAGHPNRSTGLTAAELAGRLHLHVTTVRFHLDRLEQADLIASHEERKGVGRPRRRFTAVPGQLTEVAAPEAYRLLAEVLADAITSGESPDADEAGRQWALSHAADLIGLENTPENARPARTPGAWLAKVGAVLDVLDRWGYQPAVSTSDGGHTTELRLHHCPLRQLAVDNPAVACGVHRGVIRGTLEALGEQDATVRLVPFIDTDLCVASLSTATPFPVRPGLDRHGIETHSPPRPRSDSPTPDRPTERPAR